MKRRQRVAEPTDAVVRAVATVRGVDPIDLHKPLFTAVDPDALDRLFDAPTDSLSVTFTYHGHDVEVRSDMTVIVDSTVVEPER